jgi:Na+-translocating ferredoxin:NAD+ oxidoreductase subunit G
MGVLRIAFIVIAAHLFLFGNAPGQSISQKADAAMRRVFGENVMLSRQTIAIDNPTAANVLTRSGQSVNDKVIVHEASLNGKPIGFGIVDDVVGKAQPITYITLIKPDGKIADVEVLVYREPYGGEIQYETFRNQFKGKNASSPLHVGNDIQNVSGATISSKAITYGVKKITVLFDELRKAKKL